MKFYFDGKVVLTPEGKKDKIHLYPFRGRDAGAIGIYLGGQIIIPIILVILYMIVNPSVMRQSSEDRVAAVVNIWMAMAIPFLVVLAGLIPLYYKELKVDLKDFWKRKYQIIGISVGIWIISILMTVIYSTILESIFHYGGGGSSDNEATLDLLAQGNYFVFFIFVVFIVPFIEEIIFRKVLFNHFGNSSHYLLSFVISTTIFAGIHVTGELFAGQFLSFIVLFGAYYIMSLAFTLSNYLSKNFFGGVITHVLNNALAMVLVVVMLPLFS